jgi:polyferredoxin
MGAPRAAARDRPATLRQPALAFKRRLVRCRAVAAPLLHLVVAMALAHVLLSYFVSLPRLYTMMRQAPAENWGAFVFVFGVAGALWFDFAWFREQFCTILCPYGRLQSALIDKDSIVIGLTRSAANRAVARGPQTRARVSIAAGVCRSARSASTSARACKWSASAGAGCIDACDTVMDKLARPRRLIRYASMYALAGGRTRWLRPRIIMYTALLLLGAAAMTAGLSTLKPATVSLTRMPGIPYVVANGEVRNEFLLRVLNQRNTLVVFHLEILNGPRSLRLDGLSGGLTVGALGEEMRPFVLTIPGVELHGTLPLQARIVSADGRTAIEKTIPFLGPFR